MKSFAAIGMKATGQNGAQMLGIIRKSGPAELPCPPPLSCLVKKRIDLLALLAGDWAAGAPFL